MTLYDDSPSARALLRAAFDAIKSQDPENNGYDGAVMLCFDTINIGEPSDGMTPLQKHAIACSALYGVMMDVEVEDIHPFSVAGIKLRDLVRAFCIEAILDNERNPTKESELPSWLESDY